MGDVEVDHFIAVQKDKCDQILQGVSISEDIISKAGGTDLFDDIVTDNKMLRREHIGVNEGNDTRQCQPYFDGLLCWSRTDAPGIAWQPCPPIMGFADPATGDSPRALASKVCLASGEWYQNSEGIFWSNYSLCVPDGVRFTIDSTEKPYLRWYETPADPSVLSKWLPIIRMVSQIGYSTSFTALIVSMVIFSLLRKLRNPRNRLHMHLFASFIMRAFMALLKDWVFVEGIGLAWDVVFADGKSSFIRERNSWACKLITSLWQYFIVANYAWILMEGLYLHNLVFFALCADTSTIAVYILLGWGLPVLVVAPWVIVRATIENTLCWTHHENPSLFLIIRIPIVTSILFNFLLYVNIVRVLLVKLKTSVHLQRKKMKYKRWAKSTLVLVPLFGIHYTFFLGLSYHKDYQVELVWLFCDQLFASFQGAFVAFLYCLLNGEVRAEMRRAWRARRSKREVDSFISGHRELPKISKDGINKKQHQSKGDNSTANFALKALENCPLKRIVR